MNDSVQRTILYGTSGAVLAALGWAGFIYAPDPDYGTLIGSAQLRAQVAAFIPKDADDLKMQALREEGLQAAEAHLDVAERNNPGTSAVRQLRAWIAAQRGDHARAATQYREARDCTDLTPEGRRKLGEMLAGVLSNDGRFGEALHVLDEDRHARSGEERISAGLLRARILERDGRREEALMVAVEASMASHPNSPAAADAATVIEQLGAWSEATVAWERAVEDAQIREYHVARLKLRSGATDNAVRLLERATEHGGEPVRTLLRQERALWSEAVGERAIEQLLEPTDENGESETPPSRKEEEKV